MWKDRESRISVLTFAVLVLSLECVLEGLVTQAELRTWFFHAVAAGMAAWAFSAGQTVAQQATMIAGVLAVINEGLMLSQESIDLKFLIPSAVLFLVCIVGFSSFGSAVSSSARPSAHSGGPQIGTRPVVPGTSLRPPLMPPVVPAASLRKSGLNSQGVSAPSSGELIAIVGAIAAWYSLSVSIWFDLEKLFGLRTVSAGFSELQDVARDIDGFNPLAASYLTIGYLVTYAVIISVLGSSLLRRTRWSVEYLRPDLFALILAPIALVWHVFLVVELSGEIGNNFISTGPWVGGLGLGLVFAGTIAQRTRS